jgi:hypothetical protein
MRRMRVWLELWELFFVKNFGVWFAPHGATGVLSHASIFPESSQSRCALIAPAIKRTKATI